YRFAFRDPAVRHAVCEDYRAALNEDLVHDRADRAAGRKLDCPVLVLWPHSRQEAGRLSGIDIWKVWADNVSGAATTGGHFQPEDRPHEVIAALSPFFAASHSGSRDNGD